MPLCLMIIRFCGRFEGKEALLAWTNNVLDESLSWEFSYGYSNQR